MEGFKSGEHVRTVLNNRKRLLSGDLASSPAVSLVVSFYCGIYYVEKFMISTFRLQYKLKKVMNHRSMKALQLPR